MVNLVPWVTGTHEVLWKCLSSYPGFINAHGPVCLRSPCSCLFICSSLLTCCLLPVDNYVCLSLSTAIILSVTSPRHLELPISKVESRSLARAGHSYLSCLSMWWPISLSADSSKSGSSLNSFLPLLLWSESPTVPVASSLTLSDVGPFCLSSLYYSFPHCSPPQSFEPPVSPLPPPQWPNGLLQWKPNMLAMWDPV